MLTDEQNVISYCEKIARERDLFSKYTLIRTGKTPSENYKPKPCGDSGFKESINNYLKSKNMAIPSYNIYHVPTKKKIPF